MQLRRVDLVVMSRVAVSAVLLIFTASIRSQPSRDESYRPAIPKVWNDAEIATMELPLASPAPTPVNVPAAYYYSIPVLTIYQSYPVYAAGKEPAHTPDLPIPGPALPLDGC